MKKATAHTTISPENKQWHVYIVECADWSLYTGVAINVENRIAKHNQGAGAKYTRSRRPVQLKESAGPFTKGDALRHELAIKALPAKEKEAAVLNLEYQRRKSILESGVVLHQQMTNLEIDREFIEKAQTALKMR